MNKTWKPIVAGVLDIASGALSLVSVFFIAQFGGFWFGVAILFGITGILAVIGGLYAFKRRGWRLALTGAIAASLSIVPIFIIVTIATQLEWRLFSILGIAALVLTLLSRKEFRGSTELAKSVKARDYAGKKMREEVERIREGIKRVPKR